MEEIYIKLNESQMKKVKKKFGATCDTIVVGRDDLLNIVKYQSPQICIDFDDEQEKEIKKLFPKMECDFAIIDRSELANMVRYMPPPLKG